VNLARTLKNLKTQFPNFKTLSGSIRNATNLRNGAEHSRLIEGKPVGSNPGALRMFLEVGLA
jgi:hypothetical protein